MNLKDLEDLRVLIDNVIFASTKNDAKVPTKKLEFFVSQLKGQLDGYISGVLQKIVNHAKEASGQVKNKDHWISNVEDNWDYFRSEIELNQEENK